MNSQVTIADRIRLLEGTANHEIVQRAFGDLTLNEVDELAQLALGIAQAEVAQVIESPKINSDKAPRIAAFTLLAIGGAVALQIHVEQEQQAKRQPMPMSEHDRLRQGIARVKRMDGEDRFLNE
jgi:hypothetical protein